MNQGSTSMRLAPLRLYMALFVVLAVVCPTSGPQAAMLFPRYENIKPNIDFWVKVYTEYPSTQAILHDARDLDITYGVIDLKPHDAPGARKTNQRRMQDARRRFERILRQLAADPQTADPECRRVAALFGAQGSTLTYRAASRRVRCQIGQRDRFQAGLIRSGAYIDQIKAIFKSQGLPEELAYLPHVESSFNPKAYSKFGAAGIWQFTRSTGRRFMNVGYVLDERRDPILATRAAAELLKENYEKLGSWPLAITAYNHGAAGMERSKKSLGAYPAIFESYRSRTFKFASRNFYSEFLAALAVAENYQNYFGDLALNRPARFHTVALKGYTSMAKLCDHFGISLELARSLNPALRPPVFNGQKLVPKDYPLRLPADLELAEIPSDLYQKSQKPSHFYAVQRGDTAGRIARSQGVSLDDLVMANNLSPQAVIYPNQTLRIPVPGETLAAPAEPAPQPAETTLVASNDADHAPPPETSAQEERDAESGPASMMPAAVSEVTADQREANVANEQGPSGVEIVSADVGFEKVMLHAHRPAGIIRVEVEETLGHYAEWAGVRTQQIRRLNGWPFGRTLHLHQKIKIPLYKTSAREFEESRYEYHKRLQEDFFSAYRVSSYQSYQVKRGDNLWNLCLEKFDIPMWLLKNCNPEVDFADLHLEQKILVPVVEKSAGDDEPDDLSTGSESDPIQAQDTPHVTSM
jgi:peptidoglycan lytic transglycosylase D